LTGYGGLARHFIFYFFGRKRSPSLEEIEERDYIYVTEMR
jgi:hypothetical protein